MIFAINAEDGGTPELLTWVEAGELKISISRRFPLAEAAEAHRLLEGRATTGKMVLLPIAARNSFDIS